MLKYMYVCAEVCLYVQSVCVCTFVYMLCMHMYAEEYIRQGMCVCVYVLRCVLLGMLRCVSVYARCMYIQRCVHACMPRYVCVCSRCVCLSAHLQVYICRSSIICWLPLAECRMGTSTGEGRAG